MAITRTSQLQKWILETCLEKVRFQRTDARAFFGKRFSPSYLKDNPKHRIGDWKIKKWYDGDMSLFERRTETVMEWRRKLQKRVPVTKIYCVPKKELIATPTIEVTISRSLHNLVRKDLLEQSKKWGPYTLTKRGFETVKNSPDKWTGISFKEYEAKVEEARKEEEGWMAATVAKLTPPSAQKQRKTLELQAKLQDFNKRFNPATIHARLCRKCQKKIARFEKASGATAIKKLRDEINRTE